MPLASRSGDERRWVYLRRSSDQLWSLIRDKSAPAGDAILLFVVGLHCETLRKQSRARYQHDLPSVRFPLAFQHLVPTIRENPSARSNYRTLRTQPRRWCGIVRRTVRECQSPLRSEVLWCYGSAWLVSLNGPPTIPAGLRAHHRPTCPAALLKRGGRAKYTNLQRCEYMLLSDVWLPVHLRFSEKALPTARRHGPSADRLTAEGIVRSRSGQRC